MKYSTLSILGLAFSIGSIAETNLEPVKVTAKGFEQSLYTELSDTKTIYIDSLLSMQSSLSDILAEESGIQVSQNGGSAQNTNIQIDGINLKQTLVLLDGQVIGSATLGQASLNKIPVSQIEKIEILKGNGSSLYGSSAIGGVINLVSKKSSGNISASVGSFQSKQLEASVQNDLSQNVRSGLNISLQSSEGINSRSGTFFDYSTSTDKLFDPDKDGSENQAISGYFNFSNLKDTRVENSFFFNQGEIEYDGKSSDDKSDYETTQLNSKLSTKFKKLNLMALLSRQTDDSLNFNASEGKGNSDKFITTSHYLNLQAQYQNKSFEVLTGLDYKEDDIGQSKLENKYEKASIDNTSFFTQTSIQAHSNILIGLGARIDDHSAFGEHSTVNGSISGQFNHHTLTVSSETGFRAPSFNDLYFPDSGNPDLKPEESIQRSLRYKYSSASREFSAKIFQTDLDNLIAWAPAPTVDDPYRWTPSNVDKSEIKGWRFSYQENWSNQYASLFSASRTVSENKVDNEQLALTPEYSVKAKFKYSSGKLDLSTSAQYIGRKLDSSRVEKLESYTLLHASANYQITPSFNTAVFIKNLLDEKYTPNTTYEGTPLNITVNLNYQY